MHHLKLLGETILLLGVDPKYRIKETPFGKDIYWSVEDVECANSISALLKVDIYSEQKAIQTYKLHREMIKDSYIQELLTRITKDEEIHLKIFQDFYKKYQLKTESQ